ncbi:efflux RND transporter periplasmic adaptor subunit [Legionella spiritensis]|uniref:Membrane-fusion protein AcrA n=1 Tax=Legionella spiritensis TaxID=452 RepID=A0A0W0YWE4_LEGSP|nr:efflux RND transporter periplasmic adaptor subunit [Legionella spiritensis]KTD61210.1 membrane-fusion protein AcrA [Legionella spiritensis]SNV28214.1 Membrane-fusion protein [Legionella spiritensis]
MKNKLLVFFFISLAAVLAACGKGHEEKKDSTMTYVVKKESIHKSLYFTGNVQPLRENTLTSPTDAVVETMNYHYGQMVRAGDVVMILNSSELQKQYNDTLTDYLKAKDSFNVAKAKFTGTQELWEAGLLSKNNYLSEKSSLDTARISLMQATRKLTEMIEKMDDKTAQHLSDLSLAEFDKVREALTTQHNRIYLKAPADGVLLYPPKSGDEKTGRPSVGTSVKSGQVIALVGDLSGISVEIDVPEIDIDKIHTGMDATITGVAMGKQVLHGKLIAVNNQASMSTGGTLPSFNAIVEVKQLTGEQRKWIKVGMSASIELGIDSDDKLLVPIAAVQQEKGASMVMVRTSRGALEKRLVKTGAAQADKVVIEDGLNIGDVVEYG